MAPLPAPVIISRPGNNGTHANDTDDVDDGHHHDDSSSSSVKLIGNNKRQKMIHDHAVRVVATATTAIIDQGQQNPLERVSWASSSSSSSSTHQQLTQGVILKNSNSNKGQHEHRSTTSSLLQDLIAPMSSHDFLQRAFRQHAVYIPAMANHSSDDDNNDTNNNTNNKHHRMSAICQRLYNLDVQQILRHTSSDSIFVWLHQQQQQAQQQPAPTSRTTTATTTTTRIQSIEVDKHSDTAFALYRAGHSTYCRAPPDLEQDLVSHLLEDTGLGCGQYDPSGTSTTSLGRGEVEVFISSSSSRGNSNGIGVGGGSDNRKQKNKNNTTTTTTTATKNDCTDTDTVVLSTTGWHYDFQENFTLQLSGVKRWTLRRGTVRHPLRACTPHYQSPESVEPQLKAARLSQPDFCFDVPVVHDDDDDDDTNSNNNNNNSNSIGPVEQVVLRPGDVLYFPAGIWHKVEVLEPGISINISLMATNYATVTCQALQHLLLQQKSDAWRECIMAPRGRQEQQQQQQTTISSSSTTVVDHLNKLLQELPGIIQEFQRNGGAQAILPPVLHHGKQFGSHDHLRDDSEENYKNDTNDEYTSNTKEENDEKDMEVEDHDNHASQENDEVDDSDDDKVDDDDDLVDLRTEPPRTANIVAFDPSRTALRKRLDKYRLVKNPLATLIPQRDITRFYSCDAASKHGNTATKKADDDAQQPPPFVYVLNVNYAGNEGHESAIRVRIQSHVHATLHQAFCDEVNAETMSQQLLLAAPKKNKGSDDEDDDDNDEEGKPCHTIAWLLYLGYLVWAERN